MIKHMTFAIAVLVMGVTSICMSAPVVQAAGPVDANISLASDHASVTLNSTSPVMVSPISVELMIGLTPQNLNLTKAEQVLPAGVPLPIEIPMPYVNDITLGANGATTFYGRLYVSGEMAGGAPVALIYPPSTQDPLVFQLNNSGGSFSDTPNFDNVPGAVASGTVSLEGGEQGGSGTSLPSIPTGGLVPCGGPGQQPCGFNDVMKLISNVVNYIFALIIPIATVALIIIGFQYMTSSGNVELKTLLKKRMGNLVLGIVLVLGAWLLIATILRTLGVNDAYILLKI